MNRRGEGQRDEQGRRARLRDRFALQERERARQERAREIRERVLAERPTPDDAPPAPESSAGESATAESWRASMAQMQRSIVDSGASMTEMQQAIINTVNTVSTNGIRVNPISTIATPADALDSLARQGRRMRRESALAAIPVPHPEKEDVTEERRADGLSAHERKLMVDLLDSVLRTARSVAQVQLAQDREDAHEIAARALASTIGRARRYLLQESGQAWNFDLQLVNASDSLPDEDVDYLHRSLGLGQKEEER